MDSDDNSARTFKLNFPGVIVLNRDISKITAEEILDLANLKRGDLDVLDGSPPCQGFSTAGRRIVTDNRNNLFLEFVRLIKGLMPRVFIMENVPGMAMGRMRGVYVDIMSNLKSLGYNVKSAIMDASYYGVPQSRERLIFMGIRGDLKANPSFPKSQKQTILMDIPELTDIRAINTGQYAMTWRFNRRPSPTLTKTRSLYCMDSNGKKRKISINEAKAICSFPQDFKLMGSETQQWARLGNAVMPKFMYHIAKHIRTEIMEKVARQHQIRHKTQQSQRK